MPGEFIDLRSGTIYVHDYGGQGTSLMAVHGLGGSHLNWLPVAAGLARSGRVWAPDLPGFGYSPPAKRHDLAAHTRAIVELIEAKEPPAVLVGNSLGGLVSILVAATRPELVDRLVLVAPATPPDLADPSIDWMVSRRLLLQGMPVLGPGMIRRYWKQASPARQLADTLAVVCHQPNQVKGEVVVESLRLATARRHQPWAIPALVESGRSLAHLLARKSAYAELVRRIQAPTLVIQGSHDRVVAASGIEWLMSIRPDWTLTVMEAAGHCPQLEAPGEFVATVGGWLEQTLAPAARSEVRRR